MNTPPTTQHTTAGNMPPPLNLRGICDSERDDLDDIMTDLSSMFEDESTVEDTFAVEDAVTTVEDAVTDEDVPETPKVDLGIPIANPIFALPCNANIEPCSICLENIDMVNITVTTCGHTFHSHCVFQSLMNNLSCPLCRHELIEAPNYNDESEDEYGDGDDDDDDDDGEESGVDDDETIGSNEDDTVSVEQLANKLNYMGYSMSDILKLFMDVRSDNEEKYTEEHCEGVNSTIIGIMDGTITLSSRDKRTYSSVLSGKNELYQETASPSTMTGTVEVSK